MCSELPDMDGFTESPWKTWRTNCYEDGGLEMHVPEIDQFKAFTRVTRIKGFLAATTICSENVGIMDNERVKRFNTDRVTIQVLEAGGTTMRIADTDLVGQPGDILVRDWDRPHEIASYKKEGQIKRARVLTLPRAMLRGTLECRSDPSRLLLRGDHPATRVTRALLNELEEAANLIRPHEVPVLVNMALEAIKSNITLMAPVDENRQSRALARVQAELIRLMYDPDLSIDAIASNVGMSPRTVQRLFQSVGTTPLRWLEEQRLERLAQIIRSDTASKITLTELAFAHGFNDVSTFSRAFRRKFGINPSEFRTRQSGRDPNTQ